MTEYEEIASKVSPSMTLIREAALDALERARGFGILGSERSGLAEEIGQAMLRP